MANADLIKWTTSDVDFYDLLGITFETFSESELRRAYRKTALKYHPDKVGKDFDPAKYELFQAANDVLSDPELKQKYDNHRNAKIQRQRANELFEGRRRQMKEDLESRERGGGGLKRAREDEMQNEINQELRKAAEEGRKRRAARASMMAENVPSSPAPAPKMESPTEPARVKEEQPAGPTAEPEEDIVEKLERQIREKEAAKAQRKAEKKARKSGKFVPADSPSVRGTSTEPNLTDRDTATPIKRPDIFKGLKADDKSSASPKFSSFSPSIPTPKKNDFASTMERLKAAERQRMEDQIRQQESEAAS